MLTSIKLSAYFPFAAISSVLFAIPATIFVILSSFTAAWLLYLGNFFFLFGIAYSIWKMNKTKNEDAGAVSLIIGGHIATVMGIVIACFLMLLIMMIAIPGFFHAEYAFKVLQRAPANTVSDNTNGLRFMVLANAIVGNMSAGSFVSIIFPFTIKRNQTRR
jgi:hypothetical protein